ncbi:MAG: bifunctional phosphoribosyl-AMP cyclohydrolase/phosphoribosyl-ATP diphosphatase HisIE [Acidobacteriota bacterium]|jgi:phosphoribosyl-ATP pyrophosphohydrolase/phosphoribosyl-AMP cyclohydrolase|nr:bifunctional phosphoribosyl-AMP cyclohydrolase/phosphoribosyl-ATP diphosphatase HisIE [Acidobacteriota bacterium]
MKFQSNQIDFARFPLVPAVVQDVSSGTVLMLGYMNRDALEKTLETGKVTFFSRSRQCLWTKGETSGNFLFLEDIRPDCDRDTLLVLARPAGPTCHTGSTSCFTHVRPADTLAGLEGVIRDRALRPRIDSYCSRLLDAGIERMARKVGEEAVEVVVEALSPDSRERLLEESADLVFHLLVLLSARDCSWNDVLDVLAKRRQKACSRKSKVESRK